MNKLAYLIALCASLLILISDRTSAKLILIFIPEIIRLVGSTTEITFNCQNFRISSY